MRGDRGRLRDGDAVDDPEARSPRRKSEPAPNTSSVRSRWKPTVCTECSAEQKDCSNARMRCSGEARCLSSRFAVARYIDGIWIS